MNKIYYVGLIMWMLFFVSCNEKDPIDLPKTPVLTIEIGDSIQLTKEDIAFFDSSSCILFLKEDLKIKVGEGIPPQHCMEYRILIDKDTINEGIFFPDNKISLRAYTVNYISSKTYPDLQTKILPIKGIRALIYDEGFLDILKANDLLRNGITCTLDSIKKIALHDNMVSCKFTYNNFDPIAYYVPDPGKMEDGAFNSWGQFGMVNKQNQTVINSRSDFWISGWNWELKHLSLLPAMGHVTFEYTITLNKEVTSGDYICYLSMDNNNHLLPYPIPLDQEASRVWVGSLYGKSNVIIK